MNPADLLIFALPVLLLVFMFSSQRRRQRTFADLQAKLAPGQDVVTTSGLYAQIVALDDTVVTLQTAPGQQVRWDRRAIARVVPAATEPDDPTSTEAAQPSQTADAPTVDAPPADALNHPTDEK